jgi:hypothetical protein
MEREILEEEKLKRGYGPSRRLNLGAASYGSWYRSKP